MKILIYKFEDMVEAGRLLNTIVACGTNNFRALSKIADILDSGIPAEKEDKQDGTEKEGDD